jgi:hypothetical protein
MVTGDSRPDYFVFTVDPENIPQLYDFVYVDSVEVPPGSEEPVNVQILAQVSNIKRLPLGFTPDSPWSVVRNVRMPGAVDTVVAVAKILGYKWKGSIYYPRRAPPVGSWVYLAPNPLLEDFYSVEPARRLHVGSLISRPEVPAYLDLEGLKRHVAIIAATGAGKTWASIVLIEELLKKGATILVLDPHGEYVAMKRSSRRLGPEFESAVRVVKARRDQEGEVQYKVSVADLTVDELISIANVPSNATRIRGVIHGAKKLSRWLVSVTGDRKWAGLRGLVKIIQYSIDAAEVAKLRGARVEHFVSELVKRLMQTAGIESERARGLVGKVDEIFASDEDLARGLRKLWMVVGRDSTPAYDAMRYLEELRRIGVYGVSSTPLEKLLEPGTVTVVNLSGLREEVQDHVAFNILSRVFSARVHHVRGLAGESYPYPVVVFVEEAHRFMPPRSQRLTRTRDVAAAIAAEGRKFGVYMVAISQRPSKIDPDVLSQLQGQIVLRVVNPRDQEAIRNSSEQMSQELLENLPGLNTGEAVVVGPLAPGPLMIRLRDRVLEYSGGDLSLVDAWGAASSVKLYEDVRKEAKRKLESILGSRYGSVYEALSDLLGVQLDSDSVESALRLLAREDVWASLSEETATVYGEVIYRDGRSYEVKVGLHDKLFSCSCGSRRPCSHALAVVLRAVLDDIIAVSRRAKQEFWWEQLL